MSTSLDSMLSANQTIYLNSWGFLLLAAVAVLAAQALRAPAWRNAVVLAASAYFLSFFIPDLATFAVFGGYLATVYGLGQWKLRRDIEFSGPAYAAIVTAFWAFLFLIKGPQLLAPLNPFFHFPIQIIGISYITFRGIGYVTDIDVIEDRSALSFVAYMIFFPTLLAGPIARFDDFLEDWKSPIPEDLPVLPHMHRVANGMIMKFVVADNLAPCCAYAVGETYETTAPALVFFSVIAQFFIFFFDFAGYTAMMIGISGLMGFRMPENFNKPWLATNIQDFWSRWHMSMTHFIQDYVYTPVMRETLRVTPKKSVWIATIGVNFFSVMLIALWHAPTWGFFAFGLAHGAAVTFAQLQRRFIKPAGSQAIKIANTYLARAATVSFVAGTMILWYFGPTKTFSMLAYSVGL
ncbi:MAG: MBOAT family O-acyltransferase [Parvularculaceae bacterium]